MLLTTCYLLFKGNFVDYNDALDYVLSIISPNLEVEDYPFFYTRALMDFHIILNLPSLPNLAPLRLIVLVIEGLIVPEGENVEVDIVKNARNIYSTSWNKNDEGIRYSYGTLVISLDCLLCGNYYIVAYTGKSPESGKKIFQYLFHSGLMIPV